MLVDVTRCFAALHTDVEGDAIAEPMKARTSAGLLLFRTRNDELEVFLAHPGGPYFQNKDEGAWTIPKGEVAEGEDLLERARIEFEEELGIEAAGNWIELGSVKQKGGKTVHGWAFAGDLEKDFKPVSNTFEMEWPPRSGKMERFPEVDRASFFRVEEARTKINVAQTAFLDRLIELLAARKMEGI
jgi:predicted NUDIX family NTP pyrophosphohydrolase